ncbi:hypothetical protein ACQKOE_07110 [Novosphingobium sp. NPDC080210]|uniref:hypothetical protein n=1 Tax=Novosphingobium sp. NPDC080210 TaxID=3390596 RepID=UPI003CFCD5D6
MEDLAREIVAELEPAEGWMAEETEGMLITAAKDMLDVMSADDVVETMATIIVAIRADCE